MFHNRYKLMKSSQSHDVKSKISEVLKWMQMEDEDKRMLPESLKYRDQDHMYFPHKKLLPFIRKLNESVRKTANRDTFKTQGRELIKVCKPF